MKHAEVWLVDFAPKVGQEIDKINGKESASKSFLKYTAHKFLQILTHSSPRVLENYQVNRANKNYEFWQRDSLAIPCIHEMLQYKSLNIFMIILWLIIGTWLKIHASTNTRVRGS